MSITDQQTRAANQIHTASAADLLAGLASNLESLNQGIEKEFFGIGAKLIACISTVNAMSSSLSALASLVSGDHGIRAAEALTAALTLSGGMQVRAEEGKCQLGKMRQEADRLGSTLTDFSKTAAAFNELGLQTRTETRLLRDAGFDLSNLADDVRFLALNVRKKVENALETAAELTPRIDTALRDVAKLQEEQAKDLNLVISQVRRALRNSAACNKGPTKDRFDSATSIVSYQIASRSWSSACNSTILPGNGSNILSTHCAGKHLLQRRKAGRRTAWWRQPRQR